MIEILISPKSRDELALCASFLLTVSAQASSMLEEGDAKSAAEPKAKGTKAGAKPQDPGTATASEPAKPEISGISGTKSTLNPQDPGTAAAPEPARPGMSQQVDHSPDQVLHEVYENKAPAAKPEPRPEAPATTPEYTADQVREALKQFSSEHGVPELQKLFTRFGVRRAPDLKPEQFVDVMAAVKG